MIIKIDQYGVYCKAVCTDFKQSLHINNKVSENENLNIYINKVSYKCLDMHGMPV